MKFPATLCAISLAMPLCSACSLDPNTAHSLGVARFELQTIGAREEPDTPPPFEITRSGDLVMNGKTLSGEQIASTFKELGAGGGPIPRITVDPEAVHGDIVSRFAEIGRGGNYTLSDVKRYEQFSEPAEAEHGPDYRGEVGPYELPVAIGLGSDGKACLATLNGHTFGPREFLDHSFRQLDTLVMQAGGVEAILAKTNEGRDVVARIQSGPRTPWRCVAGVINAVKIAGWPVVQLEVAGE